jgi:hypothetical protein
MTLDQIDRMVRQANPVPDLMVLEPVDASVLVLDQQRRTEMQTHGRVEVDQEQEKPRRRLLIGIAAAAAVIVIGVLILIRPLEDAPVAADQPVVNETPEPATATEIATAFVEAYGSFDVDRAASYLAADANLSRLEGGEEGWRRGNRWLEAIGFKLLLDSCEERDSSPTGTTVRCMFDSHSLRSDEIGLGPFSGSWFDFTVLEGEIVSAALHWEYIAEYSPQVWEPFAKWVAETYPEDAAIMYNPLLTLERLTEESIALWEQHSREYAEFVTSGDAYRARAEEICTAAHARLNEELQAAGIEMEVPPGNDDRLWLVPTTEEGLLAYDQAARRMMGETLPELRAVRPPEAVQEQYDHLYGLMQQYADGEEAPFTPTAEYWIHQIELQEPSLNHCTFALGR